ncbi:MAG: thioredoxin domain-containing protein [Actinocatenispora sp.]
MTGEWHPGQGAPDEQNPFRHRSEQPSGQQPPMGAQPPGQQGPAQPWPGQAPSGGVPGAVPGPPPGYGPPGQFGQPGQPGQFGQPGPGAPGQGPQPGQGQQPGPFPGPGQPPGGWQQPPAKKKRWPLFLVIGIVAFLVLCVGAPVGGFFVYKNVKSTSDHTATAGLPDVPPDAGMQKGWQTGVDGSASTIEIFEDFGCDHCATVHTAIHSTVDKATSGPGATWSVTYWPVAFAENAVGRRGASAFGCAIAATPDGGHAALDYQDTLFKNQAELLKDGFSTEKLLSLAPSALADDDEFTACVKSVAYGKWVDSLYKELTDRGMSGVPTVIVNGQTLSTDQLTKDGFAEVIANNGP